MSNPSALGLMINTMEKGLIPDPALRFGIRRLCRDRLHQLQKPSLDLLQKDASDYLNELKRAPLAVHTEDANRQHYEVPAEFFALVLGKNRKYSSAFWPEGCVCLDEAEDVALATTMSRAELSDGMKILELGCGWGSLTLAMARKFPKSTILAISNSASQRRSIEQRAKEQRLDNVIILTRNVVDVVNLEEEFGLFDRVVSVEMFEHLRNYEILFERISKWLKPEGKLFTHIFTHRNFSYLFETEGEDNWLGRYFFTGGQMPSHHLLSQFQKDLVLESQWAWSGEHYAKTSEAWLENMDRHHDEIRRIFTEVYGRADAERWLHRWRVFFLSCAELFGYKKGTEWGVSHYLFSNRGLR
jgi:cyclopropane-fatty-acyl-phospholipid synthase